MAARKIQFQVNSAILTKASYEVLDQVARLMMENTDFRLSIEGHTSSDGKYEANMTLSAQRADAVRKYLIAHGVRPESRVTSVGLGSNKPLNQGRTAAERAKNRRVELIVSNQ
ncbi:MAG: OmpA family protein [Chitinophagaceae bacterium]|nr:MAG: OmpA family protein [Chitinophagaceae bacterium]